MIKVGVIGCDNPRAAELVRVLINHPDVELKWVTGTVAVGTRLDSIVPGIVGECDLRVVGQGPLDEVNLVYLCGKRIDALSWLKSVDLPDKLAVIDMSGIHNLDYGDTEASWKYGLSEMQRRLLVHDTRLVTVPGDVATVSLLALMPMARNLLLNSPIELKVALGASALSNEGKTVDGLTATAWADDQQQEIVSALLHCQSSFDQPVTLTVTPLAERRTLAVEARFKCGVEDEVVHQLYEQYYDDHNFVFMVDRPVVAADVENTNKCLINIDKDDHSGYLTVRAMMDVLLKGSAGNAVHAMNLIFGLHERAGLALMGTGC